MSRPGGNAPFRGVRAPDEPVGEMAKEAESSMESLVTRWRPLLYALLLGAAVALAWRLSAWGGRG